MASIYFHQPLENEYFQQARENEYFQQARKNKYVKLAGQDGIQVYIWQFYCPAGQARL